MGDAAADGAPVAHRAADDAGGDLAHRAFDGVRGEPVFDLRAGHRRADGHALARRLDGA